VMTRSVAVGNPAHRDVERKRRHHRPQRPHQSRRLRRGPRRNRIYACATYSIKRRRQHSSKLATGSHAREATTPPSLTGSWTKTTRRRCALTCSRWKVTSPHRHCSNLIHCSNGPRAWEPWVDGHGGPRLIP
jgi:hypothetical protein